MEQITVKLSREAVDFLRSEGKYGDTLASICDRLFDELKARRAEKAKELSQQGNAERFPITA
jgi:hypothetical protein